MRPSLATINRRTLLLAAAGSAAIPSGFALADHDDEPTGLFSRSGWKTDFTKHSVPLDEISSGGPPRDGIPPIDQPTYVSIAEAGAWLDPLEPVVTVVVNGAARAYPIQILIWHEIVNDMLGEEPVLVTFCPLCNTAIAFDRRLEPGGLVYDFGTTGNLRFSDLVMWDRQTESWWQQLTGEAIVGELTGAALTPIPAQILGWSAFTEAYPTGDVLSRDTGFDRSYGSNPYVGYDDINSSPFLFDGEADDRMPPMEYVVGVSLEGDATAFRAIELVTGTVVNETIGGTPVVVFGVPGARAATDASIISDSRDVGQVGVFARTLDGTVLTFSRTSAGDVVDVETGTTWSITGRGQSGPLSGKQLTALPHVVVFWFAWAAGYPATRLANSQ
jgi:hypothetical protein